MDDFFPIRDGIDFDLMLWPIEIGPHDSLSQEESTIYVTLTNEKSHWQVRADELQAVLSLWTYSVSGMEVDGRKDEVARKDAWMRSAVMPKCLMLFGPQWSDQREQLREDVMWWIPWRDGEMLEVCAAYQDGSGSEDYQSAVDIAHDTDGNESNDEGDGGDDGYDDDDFEGAYDGIEYASSEISDPEDDIMSSGYSEDEDQRWDTDSDDDGEGDHETFHWTRVVGRASYQGGSQATDDEKDGEQFRVYRKAPQAILSNSEQYPVRMLAVESSASLESLYARDLLFSFIT